MQVSFIIPLFNCLPLTQAMLKSLRATLPPNLAHEIIFVDDCSTDGTREWLATLRDPPFRVVLNEKNLGFATNNNHAATLARGEFLALLNNDLVLLPGWLEPMLALLAQKPTVGFVGNVQLNAGTRKIDHRGVRFNRFGMPHHVQRGWAIGPWSRYRAVTAACCLIRTDIFLKIGGFDTVFHNGYEDMDLCLRLGRAGFHHYVANHSCVLHHVSASPDRHARESANADLFLSRWGRKPGFRDRGLAYLQRYWDRPWRFNGPRLCLALAWTATDRPCNNLARFLATTIK